MVISLRAKYILILASAILIVLACVVYGLRATRTQRMLLARIRQGVLASADITVGDFQPCSSGEQGRLFQLACLSFRVPLHQVIGARAEDQFLVIEFKDMNVLLQVPTRYEGREHLARLKVRHQPEALLANEVELRAAAYAASSRDASLWMSAERAESLLELLSLKWMICRSGVLRVEVVRGSTIKGLLSFDDAGVADLVYWTPDESIVGAMQLCPTLQSPETTLLIRKFVTNLGLPSHELCEATQDARALVTSLAHNLNEALADVHIFSPTTTRYE